jgi:hypothetical protein
LLRPAGDASLIGGAKIGCSSAGSGVRRDLVRHALWRRQCGRAFDGSVLRRHVSAARIVDSGAGVLPDTCVSRRRHCDLDLARRRRNFGYRSFDSVDNSRRA